MSDWGRWSAFAWFPVSIMLVAEIWRVTKERGYHLVLKLARAIADLAGCEQIQAEHLAEALQ